MFTENIIWLDTVDSTNTRLKLLAEAGAPEGTVVIAGEQTAGRGTGDRAFFSPRGEGLYLSLLLRPRAGWEELSTLTGRAAAAVRDGIEKACGAPCEIKWLNDIYLRGRKVCGILTELSPRLDYVVLGVGVNLSQSAGTFGAQGLGEIATSLGAEGCPVDRENLARCLLEELEEMYRAFPANRGEYLERYRAHCLTVGRQVCFLQDREPMEGFALGIDEGFGLVVDGEGKVCTVTSGTVHLMERGEAHE